MELKDAMDELSKKFWSDNKEQREAKDTVLAALKAHFIYYDDLADRPKPSCARCKYFAQLISLNDTDYGYNYDEPINVCTVFAIEKTIYQIHDPNVDMCEMFSEKKR